jgi:hypothetical protein
MPCTIPTFPFDLTITLNSAPSFAFSLEPDPGEASFTLAGASIWFAVKADPTDTDAEALIFASTSAGGVTITDASAREFQVDLTAEDTAPTATLLAGATYYAYVKVRFASGETRVRSGWATAVSGGIDAP